MRNAQRMRGRGSQPARHQVRDKKELTGAIQRAAEMDSRDRLHFLQPNGQCLEIREGGY